MKLLPPRSTRTVTLFPYATLVRSVEGGTGVAGADCHRDRLRQGRQGGARQEGERGPVADEGRQHTGAARLWGRDRTGRRLDRADDIGLRLDPAGGVQLRHHFLPLLQVRTHPRSEEHTSELQSLMRISYAVFC